MRLLAAPPRGDGPAGGGQGEERFGAKVDHRRVTSRGRRQAVASDRDVMVQPDDREGNGRGVGEVWEGWLLSLLFDAPLLSELPPRVAAVPGAAEADGPGGECLV